VERLGARLADGLIALATAVTIIAVVIPLFLNPVWVGFEQGRSQAVAWTGFSEPDLRTATDAILADLVIGPPDFDVVVAGEPVLNEREQSHMRDVRGVFIGFFALAIGLLAVAIVIVLRRGRAGRASVWGAVRTGAFGLIVGLILVGGIALLAFDQLFEVFHRVFFAGGSYTFDPATERLVQLFPFQFWQETAIVLGIVAILVAIVVAVVAQGRVDRLRAANVEAAPPLTAGEIAP
jgi:integral membrane protein (TIGR01906 family)